MMTAVRQTATVTADGGLDLAVPELMPGTLAEVIVLVSSPAASAPPPESDRGLTITDRLAALDQLRRTSKLTAEAAAAWVREIRAERDAWPDRGEPVRP